MSRVARLGAFIVATLAILAAGVFIIGSKEYLFSSTYQLKALFDNVAGLAAGADVRVGGVHSGTVHSISLPHNPGEKVTVVMDLDRSTHEIIKHDSVASIETEGVLGSQFVAITFGSGTSRGKGRRDHPERTAAADVGPAQEDECHYRQQPTGRPEHGPGDGASERGKREDRLGPGNRGRAGERQATLYQSATDHRHPA